MYMLGDTVAMFMCEGDPTTCGLCIRSIGAISNIELYIGENYTMYMFPIHSHREGNIHPAFLVAVLSNMF